MIMGELLGLMNLSGAQAFCIQKMTKVVMIRKDEHLVLATFQGVALCLENFNNSQKLTIIGLVSCFC